MAMRHMRSGSVVYIDPLKLDDDILAHAGKLIRDGGIVAFPTETVYGLGANAFDDSAIKRVYFVKQRPASDPSIVHIGNLGQLHEVALEIPKVARILAERFWPGPLTLVLLKKSTIPDSVTACLPTVGVRFPSHPVAAALVRAAGVPIAAPSANLFTRTSATTGEHVIEDLGEKVDLIIDSGPATIGIESTVIGVFDEKVRLLRPGAMAMEEISAVLADLSIPPSILTGVHNSSLSPGLTKKHYSPKAKVLFFSGAKDIARRAMIFAVENELAQGQRVGLLLTDEDLPTFQKFRENVSIAKLGRSSDLKTIARRLYAAMRHLDSQSSDVICVRDMETSGLGRAIMDRLTRAAEGKVIRVG